MSTEETKGQAEDRAFHDALLESFSAKQRSYIVENLYPDLKKALVHFISEAKRHNQIEETASDTFALSPVVPTTSKFGGFTLAANGSAPTATEPLQVSERESEYNQNHESKRDIH